MPLTFLGETAVACARKCARTRHRKLDRDAGGFDLTMRSALILKFSEQSSCAGCEVRRACDKAQKRRAGRLNILFARSFVHASWCEFGVE